MRLITGLTIVTGMLFLTFSSAQPPAVGGTSKQFVVCIDPGHPSEVNSGRTVQNGLTETHVDWVVSLQLKKILLARGYSVIVTKASEDQLVKNRDRALIANAGHADLSVRLHCDASPDTGFALYYPDRTGTTQGKTGPTKAVMVASKNAAELLRQGMSEKLKGILKDGGVRGDSKTFVGSRQGALTGSIFSEVPVVTIEMVVLSNPTDAAFIKTADGQSTMAEAVAAGIDLVFKHQSSLPTVVNSANQK